LADCLARQRLWLFDDATVILRCSPAAVMLLSASSPPILRPFGFSGQPFEAVW
jgi:hypothetical protein